MCNELADRQRYVYGGEHGDDNDDTQTDNLIAHLKEFTPALRVVKILIYDDPIPYARPRAEEPFLWQRLTLLAMTWEIFAT
jgi:hypothetical protein